jgi:hypothetical protein
VFGFQIFGKKIGVMGVRTHSLAVLRPGHWPHGCDWLLPWIGHTKMQHLNTKIKLNTGFMFKKGLFVFNLLNTVLKFKFKQRLHAFFLE